MRRSTGFQPLAAIVVAVMLPGVLGACGKSPAEPSATAFLSSLEVSGPTRIEPGGSAQFSAVGRFSDGSVRDVSQEATWSSQDTSILTAAGGGLASGIDSGETTVSAVFEGRSGFAQVMVIPAGTFRLTVEVLDADRPTVALTAAEVTVVTSDGRILPSRGRHFYGASGRTEVRTTYPPFYQPDVRSLDVTEDQQLDLLLAPVGKPVVDATGAYTLTIKAAASCAGALPLEARSRTYGATVTHYGPNRLRVELHGATFETYQGVVGNSIDGEIRDVGLARLGLAGREGVDWGGTDLLLERLPSPVGTYEPRGWTMVRIDETGISGSFDGLIAFYETQPFKGFYCSAKDHALTMTRR